MPTKGTKKTSTTKRPRKRTMDDIQKPEPENLEEPVEMQETDAQMAEKPEMPVEEIKPEKESAEKPEPEEEKREAEPELEKEKPVEAAETRVSSISPDLAAKVQAELNRIKAEKSKPSKPLVEGINAPIVTPMTITDASGKPVLTPEEKKLILETGENGKPAELPVQITVPPVQIQPEKKPEPRLMPPSVVSRANRQATGKKRNTANWAIGVALVIVVAFAAYRLYTLSASGPDKQDAKMPAPASTASTLIVPTSTPQGLVPIGTTIRPTSTPATAATAPSPAPAPAGQTKLTINSTPTGYLNVRQGPSLSYKINTKVHPGETYVYTTAKSGWYRIILNDGSAGWITAQYVTVQK